MRYDKHLLRGVIQRQQYTHAVAEHYWAQPVDRTAVSDVGLVLPPRSPAVAAASGRRARTVLLDLHETLAHVEPLDGTGGTESRGAPAGCTESGWASQGPLPATTGLSDAVRIQGPDGRGDFLLSLRPGSRDVMQVLKGTPGIEGVLWTVGGLRYVESVIQALEGASLPPNAPVGFQHVIRSDSLCYEEGGAEAGPSDWPFLPDLKPLDLVPRNKEDCLQIDDRPEYLRCDPGNALLVTPYFGGSDYAGDRQLYIVAEILALLEESELPVADFLRTLPASKCKRVDVGRGVLMASVV